MPSLNLLADVGGTNARFALSDGTRLFAIQTLPTADYPTLQDAIRAYLQAQSETVAQAAIAIANPVTGDHIQMTNHHWSFSIAAMQHELRLEKLRVINDFTAQALAIPRLTATEKRAVRAGEAVAGTPIAVLGPGTGLGVSGLIPNGDRWIALASEGGHVSFAPRDDAELAIWQYARIQYGHVSAERLINGAGLSLIDSALANAENDVSNRSPAEITAAALAGEARARATLERFPRHRRRRPRPDPGRARRCVPLRRHPAACRRLLHQPKPVQCALRRQRPLRRLPRRRAGVAGDRGKPRFAWRGRSVTGLSSKPSIKKPPVRWLFLYAALTGAGGSSSGNAVSRFVK